VNENNVLFLENAKKLERLKNNPDFQFYLEILKSKKHEFENVFDHPKPIGVIERRAVGEEFQYFKYTKEDDTERIKEAQLRKDTFSRCISLCDDWIDRAKIILKHEEDTKDSKKKEK
jgi:hypothetical protein